ncbi:unnamed protein product [Pieris macdunnoughi]|uniref:Geminin n=1 Tax=Pieris macdunnoughi TaxID=345717 RepID=A0A821U0K5_9NEOP|nr:unnamed protein product [Pieris macdunnoughi]
MPRTTRRSFKTLQHAATDTENLVGRPSKNLKHQLSQETLIDLEVKRKNIATKEVQVDIKDKVSVDDLTNPDGASEKYWEILAEKRQQALHEALDENEKLRKIIDDLKEENSQYIKMLEEANSFVEVIKEELANGSNNDTGIDVNDISTADEAADETQESTEETKTE